MKLGIGLGLGGSRLAAPSVSWPPTGLTIGNRVFDFRSDAGVVSSAGTLTSWTDQAAGLVTSTHTSTSAPTVVAGQLNGKQIIRFDSTQGLTYGTTGSSAGDLNDVCTIMAVFKRFSAYANFGTLVTTYSFANSTQGNLIYGTTDTGVWGTFVGTIGTQKTSYTLDSFSCIILVVRSINDLDELTNKNAKQTFTNTGGTYPGAEKSIGTGGGSFNLKGDLAHVCAWNGAASSSDITAIQASCTSLWGVP